MKILNKNENLTEEKEKRKEDLEPKGSLETSFSDELEKFLAEGAERGKGNFDLGEYPNSKVKYYLDSIIEPIPTSDTIPEGPSNPNVSVNSLSI